MKINGPSTVEIGKEVCLNVTGVGVGFEARGRISSRKKVKLKFVFNFAKHTAKICFVIPKGSRAVTIHAINGANTPRVTHTVFGL